MAKQARIAVARITQLSLAAARRRLGPHDRRRYARFRSTKRRREFLAARALLQNMGVSVDSSPDGRIHAESGAGVSLSHARGWVACVVVNAGHAGIDIEPMIERDFAKLGEWQFGRSGSREEFYERWTRYEARIKAFGDDKPRASHIERTWFLDGRVALSVCVPRSSRLSFSQASRPPKASATRRAARWSRSTATSAG